MSGRVAMAAVWLILLKPFAAAAGDFSVYGSYTKFEDAESCYGFGMKAGLPIGTPIIELEPRGGYYRNIAAQDVPRVELIPLELGLSVNAFPDGSVNPFLSAGGGYYFLEAERGDIDDNWGFYVGGGAEVKVVEAVVFTAELLYRNIGEVHYSEKHIEPDSVAVNLGLGLRW